ncbi:MAG: YggS family pyridoxal phosphate-dependent enzyme [Lachnospiraceae bacterium]|nr:YggS family pyridoxal phosphate-dependent enzyme [Lachnospiraceae bacterium]MBQ8666804.1 YggS family pyridoxal phosphate-dependent enzyme [Lachnospiraceae bacterium]
MVEKNISEVKKRISEAAKAAGRNENEVTLIAVSKTKPVEMIKEAYDTGIRDFGENKVQEIMEKYPLLPSDIRWHLIGHLQTNKVKYIIDKVCMIHSVDSLKLAEEISRQAVKHNVTVDILIEVNVAGEDTKFGVKPEDTIDLCRSISTLPGIRIRGLMTVAPFTSDPEENRPVFCALRQLFVDIDGKNIDNVCMDCLSMGMSGDYTVAIEEGATFVRVGTSIFGQRDYGVER